MKKLLLLLALLCGSAAAASAQNFTTVSASNIQDVGGRLVASGTLCFQATDEQNRVISFQAGGGGQVITTPFCTPVVNGAITPFQVPNPDFTQPMNIRYRITVTPRPSRPGPDNMLLNYPMSYICDLEMACESPYTFNFDNFVPNANPIPVTTVGVPGPAGPAGAPGAPGATGPAGPINTIAENGSDMAVQPKLNLISGVNATVDCVNNPGNSRTDCTFDAPPGGGGASGEWDEGTTYDAGEIVTFGPSRELYRSLVGSNLGNVPTLSLASWMIFAPHDALSITAFGAVPGLVTTTCTATAASADVDVASAANLSVGNGFACFGAGATNTMSTPDPPTVTPVLAAGALGSGNVVTMTGGATTRNYKVFACTKYGACTAASSVGSTTTGEATLGAKSASLTSVARSNTTNSFVSAAHTLVAGASVRVSSVTDTSFNQWGRIATAPTSTSFTMVTGEDTKGGATTASTGGTVAWFSGDHVTWTAVTGSWVYGVCLDDTIVGWSWPHENPVATDGLYYDYWGTTISGSPWQPLWFSSLACPTAATNASHASRITAINGTTLTLADAAVNNVTGGFAGLDSTPALLAAATAAKASANAGKPVLIPATSNVAYIFLSYALVPSSGVTVIQNSLIGTYSTVELGGSGTKWIGRGAGGSGGSGGGFASGPLVHNRSYPAFYFDACHGCLLDNVTISYAGSVNNGLNILTDGMQSTVFDTIRSTTGTTNADNMGLGMLARRGSDNFDNVITNSSFFGGPNQAFDQTTAPQIMFMATVGNHTFHNSRFSRRLVFTNSSTAYLLFTGNSHAQGPITPVVWSNIPNGSTRLEVHSMEVDSTSVPIYANVGLCAATGLTANILLQNTQVGGGGTFGLVNGCRISNLSIVNTTLTDATVTGQNFGLFTTYSRSLHVPVWGPAPSSITTGSSLKIGSFVARGPMDFPAQHSLYFSYGFKPVISSVTSEAGGTLTGTHSYVVVAVGRDTGTSAISDPVSVTIGGGDGTARITWTGVVGAEKYNVHRLQSGNYNCRVAINVVGLTVDDTGTVSGCNTDPPTGAGTGPTSVSATRTITPLLEMPGALDGGVSKFATIRPGGAMAADVDFALPLTTGTTGHLLTAGSPMTWTDPATLGGGSIAGTIADTQVAVGTAADTIGGSADLTFADGQLAMTGAGSGSYAGGFTGQLRLAAPNSTTYGWVVENPSLSATAHLASSIATGPGSFPRGYLWYNDGDEAMFFEMGEQAAPFTGKNILFSTSQLAGFETGWFVTEALLGIAPFADNDQDIGLTSRRWKDLHLSGTGYFGSLTSQAADPADTGTINLGFGETICWENSPTGTDVCMDSPASAGVSSLNTLTGAVTLSAGANITLTPTGNDIEIASSGGGATWPLTSDAANPADQGAIRLGSTEAVCWESVDELCLSAAVDSTRSIFTLKGPTDSGSDQVYTKTMDGTGVLGYAGWNGFNFQAYAFNFSSKVLEASTTGITGNKFLTATNCSDSAGPAACASAAAGAVVVDAGNTSVVVSTTAVSANSQILVNFSPYLSTRLSVTCNTTVALPTVTAMTAGSSFTLTIPSAPVTNPACYTYVIVN